MKNIFYTITHWEAWDWRVKYVPLVPAWLWYCIRSRSLWFFTPSNPALVFGGFDGVSKKDMYEHLPPGSYPKSLFVKNGMSFEEVEKLFHFNGFKYPAAVKPETGRMGFMFRKIKNTADLKRYNQNMPVNFIIQEFIDHPLEVSVFYYRFPGEQKGVITGFIKKESLQVTGDGRSTLLQLIESSSRASMRLEEMKLKHKDKMNDVPDKGEQFKLSDALNLSRGSMLVSMENEKDENLLRVFDQLSSYSKDFYYGRYDIKCSSIEDLKAGRNFSILEYNGSGGEPHHVYGNGNTLFKTCSILLHHWNILYKISRANNQKGHPYWNFKQGWNFFRQANKHIQQLKKLDAEYQV